jgi:uncharacterized protein YndB with AHSA1/START domain
VEVIEMTYAASPARIWELWTTAEGIEKWWAPDGFSARVESLQLEPGGELVYTLTATGAEQVAFMEGAGLPLETRSQKRFVEVEEPSRLAYQSLVDFVPGVEPYEALTEVELTPAGAGTRVVMRMEPLHDGTWTERLVAGRRNELENLARVA